MSAIRNMVTGILFARYQLGGRKFFNSRELSLPITTLEGDVVFNAELNTILARMKNLMREKDSWRFEFICKT